jgi:DNA processing protein
MSRGVMVVEADVKSGALITARQAVEDHGRPVFALPGRVDNPQSAGPHKLIREGAVLVENLDDIVHALDPLPQDAVEPGLFASFAEMIDDGDPEREPELQVEQASPEVSLPLDGLSDRQRVILAEMGSDPSAVDVLVERTALPAHVVLQELTFLSLKGQVKRVDGQTYVRQRAKGRA